MLRELRRYWTRFYRTGIDTPTEFRTVRPDGALQWLFGTGQLERDHTGQPVRVGGVYIDITERKQIEQTLRDSQDRLRSAMDAGGLATWIWDVCANEVLWDDATCRLWGRAPDEFRRLTHGPGVGHDSSRRSPALRGSMPNFLQTEIDKPIEFRTRASRRRAAMAVGQRTGSTRCQRPGVSHDGRVRRYHGSQAQRGSAAAVAENGGAGYAGRRHCT